MSRQHVRVLACATLLGLLAGAAPAALAVNLVPNDSFESYTTCPDFLGQTNRATPWDTPTEASPDYYNACAPGASLVSVPANSFGNQLARTGDGYMGIIARPINDYREYIEVPLVSPLALGQSYTVSFYWSLADICSQALDRLGAHLSVGSTGPLPGAPTLAVTPQIESPAGTFLTDKTNWTLITGTYVAAGGEDHLVIGNFHDNASTATTPLAGSYQGCYYYLDDVSVVADGVPPEEACCFSDGTCTLLTPAVCTDQGGFPLGPGTTCDMHPCLPVPTQSITWGGLKALHR